MPPRDVATAGCGIGCETPGRPAAGVRTVPLAPQGRGEPAATPTDGHGALLHAGIKPGVATGRFRHALGARVVVKDGCFRDLAALLAKLGGS